jgi:hypothetical protein
MTGLSLAGTVLAKRYKILEMIDGDSFKAHDLAQALGDSALHLTSQFGGMADASRCIENLEARPEIDARLYEAAGRPEVPLRCR